MTRELAHNRSCPSFFIPGHVFFLIPTSLVSVFFSLCFASSLCLFFWCTQIQPLSDSERSRHLQCPFFYRWTDTSGETGLQKQPIFRGNFGVGYRGKSPMFFIACFKFFELAEIHNTLELLKHNILTFTNKNLSTVVQYKQSILCIHSLCAHRHPDAKHSWKSINICLPERSQKSSR